LSPEKRGGPPIPVLAGIVALVVVIGVAAYFYFPAGKQAQPTSSQTSTVPPTAGSASSTSGLVLQLRLNATALAPGQTLAINVTEFNPSSHAVNATGANGWAIQGLTVGPCGSNTPLGLGVYQGHYTMSNISAAKELQIYNPGVYACPARFPISSFLFQANSDNATLGGACTPQCATTLPMTGEETASGYWTSAGSPIQQFPPGPYTVAAGDEWGTLVLLYFQVT
jgi:hypothetical protein